jgi:hypothetical protein
MQTRLFGPLIAVVFTGLLGDAQKQHDSSQIQRFSSPDGKIVAVIRYTKAPEATPESRIELRSESGQVLVQRDYRSEDGEHGYGVTKAAWTPDSQFFVYSLQSSGGHQAWHTPVLFFASRDNKVASLDHLLNDSVSNPQFVIAAPDRVTVELWFSKETKTVSLNRLRKP